MKISCRKKIAMDSRKEAVVIPVYKNMPTLKNITGKKIDDELQLILSSSYFGFEENEIRTVYIEINKKMKKVYLLNMPKEKEEAGVYRRLGAILTKKLKADKISSLSTIAFEDIYGEKKDFSATTAFIEGIMYNLYSFDKYKSKKDKFDIDELEVITNSTKLKTYIDNSSDEWNAVFKYVNMAKDLVNMPPNELTPSNFALFAQEEVHTGVELNVLDEKQIIKKGLNLVAAVGEGSKNPPRFLQLSYKGAPESTENVALVGKGVTFDTGGTNLKPSNAMAGMKTDMAGAAAVFAVTNLVASIGLKVNLNTYIPIVENVIGGNAMRPGDIVKSYSGKTVEILNTDAEGRLILADALSMATETEPEVIVDLATLTGACVVALGEHCAGLFSNRKFLSKNIYDIGNKVGEDVWELPIYEGYSSRVKSKNADIQNLSNKGRGAGSIIAAIFLKEFVDNYPWIHLDIAGTGYLEGCAHDVLGDNASGFGVRLMYYFIKQHYIQEEKN